jgi:DNA-binding NarL/FixJ family response regulator
VIGVFVVARVRFYRDGIAAALSADPRFEVVGSAGDAVVLIKKPALSLTKT